MVNQNKQTKTKDVIIFASILALSIYFFSSTEYKSICSDGSGGWYNC